MKTRIIFVLIYAMSFFISTISMPIFAQTTNSKQEQFIQFMLPKIEKANQVIANKRSKLLKLNSLYKSNHSLSRPQTTWVTNLAKQYDVKSFAITNPNKWQSLINRVDIVPSDLVLAQAINESAWGQSRFAKLGNNYFGQWCSSPGCGIVPKQRPKGATYQVRKFATAFASVQSYLHNINAHGAYRALRQIRTNLRQQNKPLNGASLAVGLMHYSTRRQAYVNSIQSIIKNYNLASLSAQGNLG